MRCQVRLAGEAMRKSVAQGPPACSSRPPGVPLRGAIFRVYDGHGGAAMGSRQLRVTSSSEKGRARARRRSRAGRVSPARGSGTVPARCLLARLRVNPAGPAGDTIGQSVFIVDSLLRGRVLAGPARMHNSLLAPWRRASAPAVVSGPAPRHLAGGAQATPARRGGLIRRVPLRVNGGFDPSDDSGCSAPGELTAAVPSAARPDHLDAARQSSANPRLGAFRSSTRIRRGAAVDGELRRLLAPFCPLSHAGADVIRQVPSLAGGRRGYLFDWSWGWA